MRDITVFSPHRDDAAFSLYACLTRWSAASIGVRVVNFFTVSSYAPRISSTLPHVVSNVRRREDQSALSLINTRIRVESLDLLDAPLRLGISPDYVCKPEASRLPGGIESDMLASVVRKYFAHGVALAPLGLGNHVDHLAVREAAIKSVARGKLGFYEDLPYAIWTPDTVFRERLSDTEERTGLKLRPCIIRHDRAVARKRKLIGRYQSQIDHDDASTIARFALTYGGGERIWIPKHSRAWGTLISGV